MFTLNAVILSLALGAPLSESVSARPDEGQFGQVMVPDDASVAPPQVRIPSLAPDSVTPFGGNDPILVERGSDNVATPRSIGPGAGAAADHIVSQQCPLGGYCWPHGSSCCPSGPNNITGPIALGLLHANSLVANPAHLAAAQLGGDYDVTFQYGNGESRFGAFAPYFLWQLSLATGDNTYADHAAQDFFDELTAATYSPSDYDTLGWIGAVEAGRTGTWVNLRPWEFHNLIPTAAAIGNAGQAGQFETALLNGLNTLDNTAPASVYSDIIGLAGGVRGLSFAGTTTFTAISATNHALINGISNLEDLANVLAGLQNGDGSWYWHSDLSLLGGATEGDKDTQTTAYAILALLEADPLVTADYSANIAAGREWLRTMQLASGAFASYPGGGENIEIEGEALNALNLDPCTDDVLEFVVVSGSECVQPGETVTVELRQRDLQQDVRGYQAFAQYDDTMLISNGAATLTTSPYGLPILNFVSGGLIDLSAGINDLGGQLPTQADALLATLSFTAGATEGPTVVSFRDRNPPTRFSDPFGQEVLPCLVASQSIVIDGTDPVITCPIDVIIECDESTDPSNTGEATATDNLDPAPVVTFVDVTSSGACAEEQVITRTWTATDCAGNTDVCVQTITVVDTTDPIIFCPADTTIDCTDSTDPSNTGVPTFAQGFEVGRDGWFDFGGVLTRVPSGTGGVPSFEGLWHAETTGAFTRWGGYTNTFPAGGYTTSVRIYLDTTLGLANDTRMDYSSAIGTPGGAHRRDFIFHTGFYNSADVTGPGAGTDRFIFNASNNSPGFPKNPAGSPTASTATGWYEVEHVFYDSGGGVLAVDVNVYDPSDVLVYSRTLSDPTDIIGGTVGGNRYGWFLNLGWTLPVDLTVIQKGVGFALDNCDLDPVVTSGDVFVPLSPGCASGTLTRTWTATDNCGNSSMCVQTITVEDTTEPSFTFCPADTAIECDESTEPGILYGVASGGIAIYYNNNGQGEVPNNQAFYKAQFNGTNDPLGGFAGAPFVFDNSPLIGGSPFSWHLLYSGLVYPESQFGLDLVLPVPTNDGSVPVPDLNAYDNFDNTIPGRILVGPVTWAINDYKPHLPDITAGSVINSIIRGQSPGDHAVDVEITQLELTSVGPIFTAEVAGRLVSDGIHHWYTPATLDSPMANFALDGEFFFSGTLTYDSTGDTGTDLIDFYSGTIIITANSPNAGLGIPLAVDDCDPVPVISFSDVNTPGACPSEQTITRTWAATDACGNVNDTDCVQTITVQDTTAPEIDMAPALGGLIISEVADPTLTGGEPKFIELTNCSGSPVDLSLFRIAAFFNGSTTSSTSTAYGDLSGILAPGASFVIANSNSGPGDSYLAVYGVEADLYNGVPNSNGNDVYQLMLNDGFGGDIIVDAHGVRGVDGTGTDWEYLDSYAYSVPGRSPNGGQFDPNNWFHAGANVLDSAGAAGIAAVTTPGTHFCGGVTDGEVDGNCETTVNFSATVSDNCCVDSGDVVVSVMAADASVVGVPVVNTVQNGSGQVIVTGSAVIGDVTSCPAVVTVTVDAADCCGNNAAQASDNAEVEDQTNPVITCPADVSVNADAGLCSAVVDPGLATATDNCDPAPAISWVRSDGGLTLTDPYDSADSPITITWTATDACGNTDSCMQTVTVDAENELAVTVELSPNIDTGNALPDTLNRCITFELWDCPFDSGSPTATIDAVVTFDVVAGAPNTAIGTATLEVPCGVYTCITARDKLHTLRRTDELFGIVGTQYVADFTGDVGGGGDWLIGGNLNDDFFIDILDFGVFSLQFGTDFLTGDTTCATAAPHADISGDGMVTNVAEFSFIQQNFLESHEANCCGALLRGVAQQPVLEISIPELRRLGMATLAIGDLNGDGWLDTDDMTAFANGARPKPRPRIDIGNLDATPVEPVGVDD